MATGRNSKALFELMKRGELDGELPQLLLELAKMGEIGGVVEIEEVEMWSLVMI